MIKRLVIFVISISFLFILSSCDTSSAPESDTVAMPAFTDQIDYNKLGSGKIAFERIGPSENNYTGIVIIDVTKKSVKTISGLAFYPALSPNGDKLAYVAPSTLSNSYDVLVMDLSNSESQDVSVTAEPDRSPAWSPDGNKIYYYLPLVFSSGDQVLIEQSPITTAGDRIIVSDTNYVMGPFSVSSSKIVFNSYYNPTGIYTMNRDGSNCKMILAKPKNRFLESPCFSPDGNLIAYLSVDRDSTYLYHSVEVKVMNADGSNQRSIVTVTAGGKSQWSNPDQINNVSVCWSPDATKLLFVVHENNLESHIYVVNTDGTGLTKITSLAGITDRKVSWSK